MPMWPGNALEQTPVGAAACPKLFCGSAFAVDIVGQRGSALDRQASSMSWITKTI